MISRREGVCKSCEFLGCEDDSDVCKNPKSGNFKRLVAWESGEGCDQWRDWRKVRR